jgi:primosomal protein N' (replication factor Y)
MLLADVAVPVPLSHALTYSVPAKHAEAVLPGARVLVPLGRRRVVGVVLSTNEGEPPKGVRAIDRPVDEGLPCLPEDLLAFLLELSAYYLAPPGEVMRLALPPIEKKTTKEIEQPTLFSKPRGIGERTQQYIVPVEEVRVHPPLRGQAVEILAHLHQAGAQTLAALERRWRNARPAAMKLAKLGLVWVERRASPELPVFADVAERDVPPDLLPAQAEAAAAITSAIEGDTSRTFLLHGVTGSGKTEVYLRAIAAARARKRGSIMLVPEIALTPQLVGRFRARFGDDVAVLHSALTPKERHVMWHRLRRGQVDVAIGARSALFAPIAKLGLVIVDEEHDSSFKQEDGVRYHARDMAILRAHRAHAAIVLGSATPSIETVRLVELGRAERLRLPQRARANELPEVEVIDLRRIGPGPTGDPRISIPLHRALEETLKRGEQAILFLNRRGFSPSVRCGSCGKIVRCPHCSVSLTFHKRAGARMRCHYCEYDTSLAQRCAYCNAPSLVLEGLGTERLEDTLAEAFPGARVARLDRDVGGGKRGQKILARMLDGEIDILVGTQMVTKGHDLPMVTLVGIINADAALSMPDFRAAERAFQLMVQVAGRAGRADRKGRVLIQTYDPDHTAVVYASRHDVDGFLERELADRKDVGYPPFSRAALLRVEAVEERAAAAAAHALAEAVRASGENVIVTGPAPAPIARLRNRYRFRAMVRSDDRAALRRALLHAVRAQKTLSHKVRSAIDVDPVQLL